MGVRILLSWACKIQATRVILAKMGGTMLVSVLIFSSTVLCGPCGVAGQRLDSIANLLTSQLRFEVNLIIPASMFNLSPALPPLLTRSLEFLTANQVPFRLLYNSTRKVWPHLTVRSFRHVENRVSHLVFVTTQSRDQLVDLMEVLVSCTVGTDLVDRYTTDQSFVQLIVDMTAVGGLWNGRFGFTVPALHVPLHFVILYWSAFKFLVSFAELLRETCFCDDGPPLTRLDFFHLINGDGENGKQKVSEHVRAEKRDFRGRRLFILPGEPVYGTWDSKWKKIFSSFSFRMAHSHPAYTIGIVLNAFVRLHNFTYDAPSSVLFCGIWRGCIHIRCSYSCDLPIDQCGFGTLSLYEFDYFSTLSFAKPTHPKAV